MSISHFTVSVLVVRVDFDIKLCPAELTDLSTKIIKARVEYVLLVDEQVIRKYLDELLAALRRV